MLRFPLFVHLITSKVSGFKTIKVYYANFQITLDKLRSSRDTLPDNLKLAAYLHGIEESYPDFASANRSVARTKILIISDVMSELEDEEQKSAESTALSVRVKYSRRSATRSRGTGLDRGQSWTKRLLPIK